MLLWKKDRECIYSRYPSRQFLFSSPRIAQKTKGNLCAAFSSHNEGGKRKRNLSAEKTGQLSYKSASFLFSLDPTLLSSEQEREKMKGVREVGRKIACLKRAQPRYSGFFLLGALLFFSRDREGKREGGGDRTHNEAILGPRPHHHPFLLPTWPHLSPTHMLRARRQLARPGESEDEG